MLSEQIVAQLAEITGTERVLTDTEDLQRFGVDRTTVWKASPTAVVFPDSVGEVQEIVRFANHNDLAIVPSGGRTGLSGGAVAKNGEVVVAMDHMNRVIEFNPLDRSVTVEAGMITEQIQDFSESQELYYPVDFASAGSSQIGGNIATNAGGIKVIGYGMTRDWVLGLKVVTGSGEILELNKGLVKNNTGYDFRHLFIGSEGTLGLICEATLQLTRAPEELAVLFLGVRDFSVILEVLQSFSRKLDLTAFEFFSDKALDKVTAHSGSTRPFEVGAPFYVLLEFEHFNEAVMETAMSVFEACVEQGWVLDGVVSQSIAQAEKLWRLRENISEAISFSKPYKNDLSVKVSRMPGFICDVEALMANRYPDFELVWFGHIGDGNLHLNILKPQALSTEEFVTRCSVVSREVAELVKKYQGSISAEHGIGLLKKDYLSFSKSQVELALMRQVKKIFDPKGVMNPGKLID